MASTSLYLGLATTALLEEKASKKGLEDKLVSIGSKVEFSGQQIKVRKTRKSI